MMLDEDRDRTCVTDDLVKQIAHLRRRGCSRRQIARELRLLPRTVSDVLRDPSCKTSSTRPRGELGRSVGFCRVCRFNVFLPCQSCKIRTAIAAHRRTVRPRKPLPDEALRDDDLRLRLEAPIQVLGLDVRTVNQLERQGVISINDLLQTPREDLLALSNFGVVTLRLVLDALARYGFGESGNSERGSGD